MECSPIRFSVCPEQSVLARRNYCQNVALRNRILFRVALVISQVATGDIDRTGRIVEQFDPGMAFAVIINKVIFVDDQQIASLRVLPNFDEWRPCDMVESGAAWANMIERQDGPSAIILSRQTLEQMPRTQEQVDNIAKGGYVLKDCDGTPDVILMATGSEVALAFHAAEELAKEGKKARVVSMPSTDVFDRQSEEYKESVLPKAVRARVAVEAAMSTTWFKYVGLDGTTVCLDHYGASAPAAQLFKKYGFTVENVVAAAKKVIK